MACKCFKNKNDFSNSTFEQMVELSKCKCASRCVVEENGRKFVIVGLDNECNLDKIKIDGYLSTDNTQRKCDYLFIYNQSKYLFVELKGCDVVSAGKQIRSSIEIFLQKDMLRNKEIKGFIVSSKYPSNDGTFRKIKDKLMRDYSQYKLTIHHKNNVLKYNPQLNKIS
jgi:hypothetical protein